MNLPGWPMMRLLVCFCMLACAHRANADLAKPGPPNVPFQTGADFWIDGEPPNLSWPANLSDPAQQDKLVIWGSWCSNPICTGEIRLGPFKAPSDFSMVVSGEPSIDGNSLELMRMTDGKTIVIQRDSPDNDWKLTNVMLPAGWVDRDVEIVARDRSPVSWLAFSEPFTVKSDGTVQPLWQNRTVGLRWHRWLAHILGPSFGIIFVLGLVGVAGYSILRRLLATDAYLAPLLISAVMGFLGYVTFWAYFVNRRCGQITALLIILLAVIQFFRGIVSRNLLPREDYKELKYPVVLLLIASLFYLGVLWLPRAEGSGMSVMAACRPTTWGLPSDNALQEWLALALHSGKSPKVIDNHEWSSSDRPPLEAGVQLLSARVLVDLFHTPFGVNAQLAGLLLQLSWIYGLWALLRALGCTHRAAAQIVLCLIPAPVLYINSVFVWAKLSAAAYAIGMTVILCLRGKRPLTLSEAAVAGGLFSLAILCHSGISFFALPVLALWFLLPAGSPPPSWSCVLVLIAASSAVFLPWSCYQKFFDPPGNHLIKLSFAGAIDSNSNSVPQTLRNAYGSITRATIVDNKIANLQTPFKGNFSTLFQLFPADTAKARVDNFFYLFRSCGVFLLGALALPLLLLRRNRHQLRPVLFLLLVLTLAILFWCLAMFGPFGVPLVLLALLAWLLRLIHPVALLIVAALNLVQFLWIYGRTFPYPPAFDCLSITAIVIAGTLSVAVLSSTARGFANASP
jgi:hypothetical protein